VNALNLPMYVVGGGVSSAWEAFSPFIFEELRQRSGLQAQGIYRLAVVVWLMMWQRLDGRRMNRPLTRTFAVA